MRYNLQRLNREKNKADRAAKLKMDIEGAGIYLFENKTSGDLILPKPAMNGVRTIRKGCQFQGDSYFMSMVKTNELKLMKTIKVAPQKYMVEAVKKVNVKEEKLILDQPDKVTVRGKVEHVVVSKKKKIIKEKIDEDVEEPKEILINEDPVGSIELINE